MVEVFDADAALVDIAEDFPPFPFRWEDEMYELPNMGMLSTNDAMRLAELMQAAGETPVEAEGAKVEGGAVVLASGEEAPIFQLYALLNVLVEDEGAVDALRSMPSALFGRILMAWESASTEAMGDLGKEPEESSPPNRAERRSQSTSRGKGSTSKKRASKRSAA